MRLCIIIGTRPEIIKVCPLIRFCRSNNISFFVIHTGQHYSYEMDKLIFNELELPEPEYNLHVGGVPFRFQINGMVSKIQNILKKEKCDAVLIIGDTNSMLSGSLVANQKGITLAHVEAGLRSHNLSMLEEVNRIIADNISDFLFAPTENAKKNLIEEGIAKEKIFVTGNTIVDSLQQNIKIAEKKCDILKKLGLKEKGYIVLTAHRKENVDIKERLKNMLEGIKLVHEVSNYPIIWPIHPRTAKMIDEFDLSIPKGVKKVSPLGYLEFLQLEEKSRLIMTDSGGLQEEGCILKVPCITLRDDTERPETLDVGSNMLVGVTPEAILEGFKTMSSKKNNWENPFGDGKAAERIVSILKSDLSKKDAK